MATSLDSQDGSEHFRYRQRIDTRYQTLASSKSSLRLVCFEHWLYALLAVAYTFLFQRYLPFSGITHTNDHVYALCAFSVLLSALELWGFGRSNPPAAIYVYLAVNLMFTAALAWWGVAIHLLTPHNDDEHARVAWMFALATNCFGCVSNAAGLHYAFSILRASTQKKSD